MKITYGRLIKEYLRISYSLVLIGCWKGLYPTFRDYYNPELYKKPINQLVLRDGIVVFL